MLIGLPPLMGVWQELASQNDWMSQALRRDMNPPSKVSKLERDLEPTNQ